MSVTVITNADRARWQRQAVRELASILGAHADLQVIAWTVSPAGGGLSGRVNGLVPAAAARAVFDGWRHALALDDLLETASADGTLAWLRARAWRNGVRVTVTSTVIAGPAGDEGAVTS